MTRPAELHGLGLLRSHVRAHLNDEVGALRAQGARNATRLPLRCRAIRRQRPRGVPPMGDMKYRANSTFDGLHQGEEFIGDADLWAPYVEAGSVSPVGPAPGSSPDDVEPDETAVALDETAVALDESEGEEPGGES